MSLLVGVVEQSARIDKVISELFPSLSRSRAAALVKNGRVCVDGVPTTRPSTKCNVGTQITIDVPEPTPDRAEPQDLPLSVVYEDADLVVVNKVAGMVVHPSAGHADGTLVNALLFHIDGLSGIGGVARPGIVHRLDRGTSGLLVVAKHDAAHTALAAQFTDKTARRRYVGLCYGRPKLDGDRIETLLGRHPKDRMRYASTQRTDGKRAVTHWRVLARAEKTTLVECRLETGRTHQIRVHMSELHHPLVNDPIYSKRRKVGPSLERWMDAHPKRPLLHAWRLGLTHPTSGERIVFSAPLPVDFREALDAAGLSEDAVPTELIA